MDFTAENLERAVVQFYQSATSAQTEAHEFLTAAKGSLQAWVFVWELLQPQRVTEVQFYGATTLHTKIEKCLNELTPEQEFALRDQLLTCIVSYSNGPKIVLNRLCVSLAALIFRSEHWSNALADLLATFTPDQLPNVPVHRVVWILLEILALLPEQFGCMSFQSHRRSVLQAELEQKIPQILRIIESILTTQTDSEVMLQATKCITSWAFVGMLVIHSQSLVDQLVAIVFNFHKINPGVCEKSLEALAAFFIHQTSYKYPQKLLEILEKILPLREIIAREHMNPHGPDRNMIRNVYTLLITFGESHSDHLVTWIIAGGSSREQSMALITALLHCSGAQGYYPVDENYSRLSLGFWYTLQDQIISQKPAQYELCMSFTGPIYRELVNILMCKARLPDEKNPMSKEDAESFRCFRQDIGDTMMYCFSILKETTLSLIKTRLEKIKTENLSWQDLEACLFSLCSIAENVYGEEETFLPSLFLYIETLPFDRLNPKVLSTALDTIGRYGEWISFHSATLEHVLPIVLLGLKVPDAAPSATMALKDITRDCIEDIEPFISLILDSSQETLHSGRLKMTDNLRLMHCTGRVLSILPMAKLLPSLEIILSPYLVELNSLSTQEPNVERKTIIVSCLKMLATIMVALDNDKRPRPHPSILILEKLLPVLHNVTSIWYRDSLVMESVYAAIKRTIIYIEDTNTTLVNSVIELIVTSFREYQEPTALGLSCQVIISLGYGDELLPVMQTFMRELCTTTMTYVSSTPNLSDHTELLREFFLMNSQVARKCPNVLAYGSDSDCLPIIHLATMTLGLPELATVKSASLFLVHFICDSRESPLFANVVNMYGEQIVQRIMKLIGGEAMRGNVEPLGDILIAINKKYYDNLRIWLHQYVNETLCPRTTQQQREAFIQIVVKTKQPHKRKLNEHIQEFTMICRGLIGVEVIRSLPSL